VETHPFFVPSRTADNRFRQFLSSARTKNAASRLRLDVAVESSAKSQPLSVRRMTVGFVLRIAPG